MPLSGQRDRLHGLGQGATHLLGHTHALEAGAMASVGSLVAGRLWFGNRVSQTGVVPLVHAREPNLILA